MLEPVNTNEVKAKAERLIYDNESFLINDPTAPLESPLYNEIGVRLNERMRDATYQFMLGMIDEKDSRRRSTVGLKKGQPDYRGISNFVSKHGWAVSA